MCQTAVLRVLQSAVASGRSHSYLTLCQRVSIFVEVGAAGRQVEKGHVVVFPALQPRLERGGMVQAGIVEDQHRRTGPGGDPGVKRVDEKGGIQGPLAGSGVQLLGGGVEQAQYVEARAVTRLGGDVFAGKLPAVRDGRD